MNPQEIEKLLGGYATDTLTEEERRTLFAAALGNQALFDALADEQALRELLQDAPSRAHLLAAVGEERGSIWARLAAWMRRPSVLALAAAVAAGIVTVAVVIPRRAVLERPAMVAVSQPPQPEPAPLQATPEGAPEPKPKQKPAVAQEPASNLRRALTARKEESERDAVVAQNAPAIAAPPAQPPPVAATAPPAPPPPPPAAPSTAAPAQPQSAATEQVQTAQSNLPAAKTPAGAGSRQQALKDAPAPGARDLYYAMQPSVLNGFVEQRRAAKAGSFGRSTSGAVGGVPGSAPAVAGGVRYSILRRNADGSFAEVDPSTVFAVGDALRVRFETNQAGNLAVMERRANGKWTLRLAARMQQGEPVQMPSESTINVRTAGAQRFFVRFSRSLRNEPQMDNIKPTANLLRESAANSVYLVNPAWTSDSTVDFELTIDSK